MYLPNFAGLFADHRVAFFAVKSRGEFRHVGNRSNGTETRERMRIGIGLQTSGLGTLVRSPDLRPSQKESLFRREAVDVFALLSFQ